MAFDAKLDESNFVIPRKFALRWLHKKHAKTFVGIKGHSNQVINIHLWPFMDILHANFHNFYISNTTGHSPYLSHASLSSAYKAGAHLTGGCA
jgi:hypothetical protein